MSPTNTGTVALARSIVKGYESHGEEYFHGQANALRRLTLQSPWLNQAAKEDVALAVHLAAHALGMTLPPLEGEKFNPEMLPMLLTELRETAPQQTPPSTSGSAAESLAAGEPTPPATSPRTTPAQPPTSSPAGSASRVPPRPR